MCTAGVGAWTSAGTTGEVRAHAARMLRGQLTGQLVHGEPSPAADPLGEGTAALRTLTTPALVGVGEDDMLRVTANSCGTRRPHTLETAVADPNPIRKY